MISYVIDDGTGLIACQLWTNDSENDNQITALQPLVNDNDISNGIDRRCGNSHNGGGGGGSMMKFGELVNINGKLEMYRNDRVVNIRTWKVETDVNSECVHWLSMVHLHQTVYQQICPALINTRSSQPPSATSLLGNWPFVAPSNLQCPLLMADIMVLNSRSL